MDLLNMVPSTLPTSQSASYKCILTNNWSKDNHPKFYNTIKNSAHWSDPVLASHNSDYEMWAPGSMASKGVEDVAELGSTSTLEQEISDAKDKGSVGEFVVGDNQFNKNDPPQQFEDITLSPDFPLLSTISMVAPSPDWFSGFYSFSPIDDEVWYQSFEIASYPWDAGTEQGDSYSLGNPSEDPHVPIVQLTKETVPSNGILLDGTETEVLPMAFWKCTLADTPKKCKVDTDWMHKGDPEKTCLDWAAKNPSKRCRRKSAKKNCGSVCFPHICDRQCMDSKDDIKVSKSIGRLSCEEIADQGLCKNKRRGFKMSDYCPLSCDSCLY